MEVMKRKDDLEGDVLREFKRESANCGIATGSVNFY